jgi:hypothetical protein
MKVIANNSSLGACANAGTLHDVMMPSGQRVARKRNRAYKRG